MQFNTLHVKFLYPSLLKWIPSFEVTFCNPSSLSGSIYVLVLIEPVFFSLFCIFTESIHLQYPPIYYIYVSSVSISLQQPSVFSVHISTSLYLYICIHLYLYIYTSFYGHRLSALSSSTVLNFQLPLSLQLFTFNPQVHLLLPHPSMTSHCDFPGITQFHFQSHVCFHSI
jgi:hypothetical protein